MKINAREIEERTIEDLIKNFDFAYPKYSSALEDLMNQGNFPAAAKLETAYNKWKGMADKPDPSKKVVLRTDFTVGESREQHETKELLIDGLSIGDKVIFLEKEVTVVSVVKFTEKHKAVMTEFGVQLSEDYVVVSWFDSNSHLHELKVQGDRLKLLQSVNK